MATYMEGALKTGSSPSEYGSDVGFCTFIKQATIQAATVAAVNGTITLPRGAQIHQIYVDTTVAWTATGAVTFTAGTASAGTQDIT